jgi:hypothetical protein
MSHNVFARYLDGSRQTTGPPSLIARIDDLRRHPFLPHGGQLEAADRGPQILPSGTYKFTWIIGIDLPCAIYPIRSLHASPPTHLGQQFDQHLL